MSGLLAKLVEPLKWIKKYLWSPLWDYLLPLPFVEKKGFASSTIPDSDRLLKKEIELWRKWIQVLTVVSFTAPLWAFAFEARRLYFLNFVLLDSCALLVTLLLTKSHPVEPIGRWKRVICGCLPVWAQLASAFVICAFADITRMNLPSFFFFHCPYGTIKLISSMAICVVFTIAVLGVTYVKSTPFAQAQIKV